MKQFISHKVVHAAQIVSISLRPDAAMLLTLDDNQRVPHPGTTKYTPFVGDYYIVYKDGYRSLSPKLAFEEGYTEVKGLEANG